MRSVSAPWLGPDHHDPTMVMTDQPHAAQDERPHDDLADVGFARDEPAKVRALDPNDAAVGAGTARDQDLATAEQVQLAGELQLGMDGEHIGLTVVIEVEDLYRALEHQEAVDVALAALVQQGAPGQSFFDAIGRHPRGHLLAQPREGLRLACVRIARIELRLWHAGIVWHGDGNGARGAALQPPLILGRTGLGYGLSTFVCVAISCLWGSVSGSSGVTNAKVFHSGIGGVCPDRGT